jgi:hypothetical protein
VKHLFGNLPWNLEEMDKFKDIDFGGSFGFFHKRRGNFYTFHSRICNEFLSLKKSDKRIVLVQMLANCATIDAIRITPPNESHSGSRSKPIIDFIQATISCRHNVSSRGFFGMLMIIHSLKSTYNLDPIVRFIFVVPPESYDNFESSEKVYLAVAFRDINVYVAEFKNTSKRKKGDDVIEPVVFYPDKEDSSSMDIATVVAQLSGRVSLLEVSEDEDESEDEDIIKDKDESID